MPVFKGDRNAIIGDIVGIKPSGRKVPAITEEVAHESASSNIGVRLALPEDLDGEIEGRIAPHVRRIKIRGVILGLGDGAGGVINLIGEVSRIRFMGAVMSNDVACAINDFLFNRVLGEDMSVSQSLFIVSQRVDGCVVLRFRKFLSRSF